MTDHIWDDLLSEQDKQVIEKAGYDQDGATFWDTRGTAENPLLLIIDMQRLIVGEDVPILDAIEEHRTAIGEIAWEAVAEIDQLLDLARDTDVPVIYTRLVPDSYEPDDPDVQIVDQIGPRDEDPVLDKAYASAFYGTDLLTRLVKNNIDTLIIVGNSTSGCLRGTTVDAQTRGFQVVLPQECIFDRIQASHKIGLLDMWMKYADVRERSDVEDYLRTLAE